MNQAPTTNFPPNPEEKPIQQALWCPTCEGSGKYLAKSWQNGLTVRVLPCPLCKGTGRDTAKGKLPITSTNQTT